MKNLVYSIFVVLLFTMVSCEDHDWPEPDIEQVPVYSITNISGGLYAIEVYKNKPLMIEFENANIAFDFATDSYLDESTATDFGLSYKIQKEGKTAAGEDTLYTYVYSFEGLKADNLGSLKIGKVIAVGDTAFTNHTISISEEKRWN